MWRGRQPAAEAFGAPACGVGSGPSGGLAPPHGSGGQSSSAQRISSQLSSPSPAQRLSSPGFAVAGDQSHRSATPPAYDHLVSKRRRHTGRWRRVLPRNLPTTSSVISRGGPQRNAVQTWPCHTQGHNALMFGFRDNLGLRRAPAARPRWGRPPLCSSFWHQPCLWTRFPIHGENGEREEGKLTKCKIIPVPRGIREGRDQALCQLRAGRPRSLVASDSRAIFHFSSSAACSFINDGRAGPLSSGAHAPGGAMLSPEWATASWFAFRRRPTGCQGQTHLCFLCAWRSGNGGLIACSSLEATHRLDSQRALPHRHGGLGSIAAHG